MPQEVTRARASVVLEKLGGEARHDIDPEEASHVVLGYLFVFVLVAVVKPLVRGEEIHQDVQSEENINHGLKREEERGRLLGEEGCPVGGVGGGVNDQDDDQAVPESLELPLRHQQELALALQLDDVPESLDILISILVDHVASEILHLGVDHRELVDDNSASQGFDECLLPKSEHVRLPLGSFKLRELSILSCHVFPFIVSISIIVIIESKMADYNRSGLLVVPFLLAQPQQL